jgi:hypothetical protein
MKAFAYILLLLSAFTTARTNCYSQNSNINACKLAESNVIDTSAISRNVKQLFKNEIETGDGCIDKLIEALTSKIVYNGEYHYINSLNVLNNNADEGTSEQFIDVAIGLFHSNFDAFVTYLYANRNKKQRHGLEASLIEGLSMEISMADEPNAKIGQAKKRQEIELFMEKSIKANKLSKPEELYVRGIYSKVNPKMFE